MTFCGYNDEMAEGIVMFNKGLAIQTEKRAVEEGVSLSGIPAIELAELRVMLEEVTRSPKREALAGITALAALVIFAYEELERRLAKDSSLTAEQAFAEMSAEINDLMFTMEEHYYQKLRPHLERGEAIRQCVKFLEAHVRE